jgi:trimeric autotransporter adhesin
MLRTAFFLSAAGFLFAQQQYTISTVAGGAPPITPVSAVKTSILVNEGFAVSAGSIYFSYSNCIFKIDVNGTMTRLAGTGRLGSSPDGTPAINAQFSSIRAVAVDRSGTVYFVDTNQASGNVNNTLVRRILADGTISTVIGGLNAGLLENAVRLAFDSNNDLFVIDGAYIRKIAPDGTATLVAGNGTEVFSGDGGPAIQAGLGTPQSIAVDASGKLYVGASVYVPDIDDYEPLVRVVTTDGIIHEFAGNGTDDYFGDGGPATAAAIGAFPSGLAVDAAGDVYIADDYLRVVTPDGIISTVAGGEGCCVRDVAIDTSGQLYINFNSTVIGALTGGGTVTIVAGGGIAPIGDGGPATSAVLSFPIGIAVDASHNVYLSDDMHNRIRKMSASGVISTFAGNGNPFGGPPPGPPVDLGPAVNATLSCGLGTSCQGMATDSAGDVYFADSEEIRKVSAAGIITTIGEIASNGMASDGKNLYIADWSHNRLIKIASDGTYSSLAGTGIAGHSGDGGPATSAQLYFPIDVAVDGAGNVYIAENYQSRVRKVTPDGNITTIAGGGTQTGDGIPATSVALAPDIGIAADQAGNVFVAEYEYNRIRRVSTDGTISTIAGGSCTSSSNNNCAGYSGDGGPASQAQLWGPARLAVDTDGSVYFTDVQNNAVRVLRPVD